MHLKFIDVWEGMGTMGGGTQLYGDGLDGNQACGGDHFVVYADVKL